MSGSAPVSAAPNQIIWNGQRVPFKVFIGDKEVTHERDWKNLALIFFRQVHAEPASANPSLTPPRTEIVIEGPHLSSISEASPTTNPLRDSRIRQITIDNTPLSDPARLGRINHLLAAGGKEPATVFSNAAPFRAPPLASLDAHLVEVAGGGRCGPASIVHQMSLIAPEWNDSTPQLQVEREQLLRTAAMQNMVYNENLRNDPVFRLHILEASKTLVATPGQITDPAITGIIAKYNTSAHTAETISAVPEDEMNMLIQHYAQRIAAPEFWIDFAFVYALKYPLPNGPAKDALPEPFKNGISIAILQGNPLNVLHHTCNDVLDPNTLYLWFNGRDHYKSVKRDSTQLQTAIQQYKQNELLAAERLAAIRLREQTVTQLRTFVNFDTGPCNDQMRISAAQTLMQLLQNLGDEHFRDYCQFIASIKPENLPNDALLQFQAANLPVIQTFLNVYLRAHYPLDPIPQPLREMPLVQLLNTPVAGMPNGDKEELLNEILRKLYLANPQCLCIYVRILLGQPGVAAIWNQQQTLFNYQITNLHVIQQVLKQQLNI